ncbi:hypothetical protein GCM10020331_074250 [Ectobacillus funiculus]
MRIVIDAGNLLGNLNKNTTQKDNDDYKPFIFIEVFLEKNKHGLNEPLFT